MNVLVDGYIYAGKRAHTAMDGSAFIVTDRLRQSYITTAALRRSGNHPDRIVDLAAGEVQASDVKKAVQQLCAAGDLHKWICGSEQPHSDMCHGTEATIDVSVVLYAFRRPATVTNCKFVVIASNEERVIMGCEMAAKVDAELEADESPMQATRPGTLQADVARALEHMHDSVRNDPRVFPWAKRKVDDMINRVYRRMWRGKYELEQPASFPPMRIRLKEGTTAPSKIRRHYRWTSEQKAFLRKLLKKLVDVGVISKVESEWCCPVVLALKPDGTWRLCVDPSKLNEATIPMIWEMPRVRETLQEQLAGMRWMSKFDFCAITNTVKLKSST